MTKELGTNSLEERIARILCWPALMWLRLIAQFIDNNMYFMIGNHEFSKAYLRRKLEELEIRETQERYHGRY